MKWNYGSRSRSRHSSAVAAEEPSEVFLGGGCEGLRRSLWADMPIELLREVLIRVEECEAKWPLRKSVVACAGVCRSWREILKEVVQTPEVSGRITFPIAVKQPGPRDTMMQCFLKRSNTSQTFHLYLNLSQALTDDGKFLLAARKYRRTTCTDYIISLHAGDMSKARGNYLGKLRSNFLGTKFTVYDASPPVTRAKMVRSHNTSPGALKHIIPRVPVGNYEVAHISYELNGLAARGPRKMQCVMDTIPASSIKPGGVAPTQTDFPILSGDSFPTIPFFRSKSTCSEKFLSRSSERQTDGSLVLKNKAPRWHEQLQCWCLNFHGRVTVASVKNFQLVASPENGVAGPECEKVILQFGKVAKDVFTMDFRYPLSPFLAFAICLSNFDSKLACE
ncbi:tubby-like F-box protein 6 [Ipomoea triloba]|uniref:tubby-like F-box protein 6 n=1 Tax=Ipomoea triloba TaxID=35885 RepID=UPI00125D91FB|nr:tubby-like F-box protein 6 [Ipomoea triloba]XP_031098764.1 tubby-like F-box protein 6 [Ipomoea triloba]XP_031098765.1 tubby-like F-box protein 6 [Ipomoea triloba]